MVTQISDWNDLEDVRNNLSEDYELVNDLDQNTAGYDTHAGTNANNDDGWNPIGNDSNPFTGTFDGQGYTISDIFINRLGEDYGGLFGYVSGSVSNLYIEDIFIYNSGRYTGSLAGQVDGTVSKCGIISGSVSSNSNDTGGFCGANTGSIDKCFSGVTIEDSEGNTGGFAGNVGGIVGSGDITNCFVFSDKVHTRDIQNPKRAGGFCGVFVGGTIKNCYSVVKDLKNINSSEDDDDIYYFVGEVFSGSTVSDIYANTEVETTANLKDATGLTTDEITGSSAETNMNLDFSSTWDTSEKTPILQDLSLEKQSQILGFTALIEISDWNDLDNARNNLGIDHKLVNDLDKNTTGYDSVASDTANNNKGFKPIGDSSNPFIASFNGNGYKIKDLFINRQNSDYVGIFGYVEDNNSSQFKNFLIKNANVTGNNYVGALAGRLAETDDVGVVDSVINGNDNVGGIFGSGTGYFERVFVGDNTKIEGSDIVGGIGGYIGTDGYILQSYSRSDVTGSSDTGGVVGLIGTQFSTRGSAEGTYFAGTLPNGGDPVGNSNLSTDSSNWFDKEKTGISNSSMGSGLTTEEMTGQEAVGNMDAYLNFPPFEAVTAFGGDYPILNTIVKSEQTLDVQTEIVDTVGYTGGDTNVYIHDTQDYSLNTILNDGEGVINYSLKISENYIAYGGIADKVYLHSKDTSKLLNVFEKETSRVKDIVISEEDNIIAYAGYDSKVFIHDLNDYSLLNTLDDAVGDIEALDYSENYIAYSDAGPQDVIIRDNTSYNLVKTISDTSPLINDIAFSKNEDYLAKNVDQSLYVYDTSDWSLVTTLTDSIGGISEIAWSDDYLAYSSTDDMTAYVYDTTSFTLQKELTESSSKLESINLNENIIAYAAGDIVYVHDISDWSLITTLEEAKNTVLDIVIDQKERVECDLAGSGTDSNPYIISEPIELNCLTHDINATYKLGQSLPMGDISWSPIVFNGKLIGDGKSLVGLQSTLFKDLNGTVVDMGISDMTTKKGALAKNNKGTIRKVGSRNITINGDTNVGGLVGINNGDIKQTYIIGSDITGSGTVGGLVGSNKGDMINIYVDDVNVTANSGDSGGVIAKSDRSVENIYSGDLTVSGDTVGDIIGVYNGVSAPNSYIDQSTGTGFDASATELTTEQMIGEEAKNNMFGFDFSNIWNVVAGQDEANDDYPVLANVVLPPKKEEEIIEEDKAIDNIKIDIKVSDLSSEFVDNFTDLVLNNINSSSANIKSGALGTDGSSTSDSQDSLGGEVITNNLGGSIDSNILRYTLSVGQGSVNSSNIKEFGILDSNGNLLYRYVFNTDISTDQDILLKSDIISR